jgi:hypothetical protein
MPPLQPARATIPHIENGRPNQAETEENQAFGPFFATPTRAGRNSLPPMV